MTNIIGKRQIVIVLLLLTIRFDAISNAAYWDPDAVRNNSAGQLDNWLHYYRGLEQVEAKSWHQAENEFGYYFRNYRLHRHMFGIAYFGMGFMFQAKGLSELAIDNYKMAIKEDTHPDVKITDKAWLNIGTIYMNKKSYKDAIESYRKAVAADPGNGQAHYSLGLAYAKIGELEQAENESAEAKKLGISLPGLDSEISMQRKKIKSVGTITKSTDKAK